MGLRGIAVFSVLVLASAGAALATGLRAPDAPEPELAFDCAPPRPGPGQRLGDTLCVGTTTWRRRFPVLRAIRTTGSAVFPAWSPDGQRLLFRLALSHGDRQLDDIGLISVDGSGYVDLTNDPARPSWGADWSPDGRRIVFNEARGSAVPRLFVMNADGSGLHAITRIWGEYPSWSPDGGLIAFMSNRCACNGPEGAEYDVYTVRPDGAGLQRLSNEPGEEAVAGWSPDGRELAYGRDPEKHPGVWIVPREGGAARRLVPPPADVPLRGMTWQADGSFFANGETPDRLYVYRVAADGTTATRLLEDADSAELRPSGSGKARSALILRHRWARSTLRLFGRLTVGGSGAAGRRVILGRLGTTLPTRRLRAVVTRADGRFGAGFPKAHRRAWRVATAFYGGSEREWSTAAFDTLRR